MPKRREASCREVTPPDLMRQVTHQHYQLREIVMTIVRSPRISAETIYEVETPEGALRLDWKPERFLPLAVHRHPDRDMTLLYGVTAPNAESPLEYWDGFAEWQEFRTEWDRDQYAQHLMEEGQVVFVIERHEHSTSRFTSLGRWSKDFHYQRSWDSRPSIIVGIDPEGTDDTAEAVDGLCEQMTAWANGEVYDVVKETFTPNGLSYDDREFVCRTYGLESFEQMLTQALSETEAEDN